MFYILYKYPPDLLLMPQNLVEIYINLNNSSTKVKEYEITTISNLENFNANYKIVNRRYSQFLKLHNVLKQKIKILPKFPGKTILNCTEEEALKREKMFNAYFKYLSECMKDGKMEWEDEVIRFLTESDY